MKSIYLIFLLISVAVTKEENPEITIEQGTLKGKIQTTPNGRSFNSFTGIPFVKPPVGALRFKAPVPPEPWEGVFDATRPHPVCPQFSSFLENSTVIGDEDCLYLNVYTPQLPDSDKELLPVMFFIHGGAWQSGTAGSDLYGPDLLLDKDIVLVTANYRLGVLGFATTGNELIPGNNGLKDQSQTIKWIRKNIAKFGGDPDKITVFGQSAGGASAHYHMISPSSRKLIKGVIAQSGNALSIWAMAPNHQVGIRTRILAGLVGCSTYKFDEMVECMMEADAHAMIRETKKFMETDMDPMFPFRPVLEPPLIGAFLVEDPIDIIKSGKMADIPLMTGITTEDGGFRTAAIFKAPEIIQKLNDDFLEMAPVVLMYRDTIQLKNKDTIGKQVKEFYFQDKPIEESTKDSFTKMYTDVMFLMGADSSVEMHTKYSAKPVYYYLFGYKGSASICDTIAPEGSTYDYGVCHCDELPFLFKSTLYPNYTPTDSDKKVAELMTTLWANFAKHGNPTPETDATVPVKWEPAGKGKHNYLYIKGPSDLEVKEGLYAERAKFWRDLPLDSRRIKIRDEL